MRSFLWASLCWVGCAGSAAEDSGTAAVCDGSTGTVWGDIVDYDGNLHGGSTVVFVHPDGEDGFALPATSDGSYEVDLSPGHYRFSAESDWGCLADPEPEIDVEACERHQAELVMDLCFGR